MGKCFVYTIYSLLLLKNLDSSHASGAVIFILNTLLASGNIGSSCRAKTVYYLNKRQSQTK